MIGSRESIAAQDEGAGKQEDGVNDLGGWLLRRGDAASGTPRPGRASGSCADPAPPPVRCIANLDTRSAEHLCYLHSGAKVQELTTKTDAYKAI